MLWAIGAPIAFNIICLYGANSTTQIFAGHIINRELSAVAIDPSVISNFSFGFLFGMGSTLETLCGQAFGGGPGGHAGRLHAAVVDRARRLRRAAHAAVYVSVLGWGVAGAALAYDVSSWLTSLTQVAYVVGWCRDGWTGLSAAIEQHEHQRVGGDAVHRPQRGHQVINTNFISERNSTAINCHPWMVHAACTCPTSLGPGSPVRACTR